MRILQRYILIELIRVLLLVISVLTVLLLFVGVFQTAAEYGLGPLQVLPLLPYIAPSMLPYTIPATLLLSVCVGFGGLAIAAATSEQSPLDVECLGEGGFVVGIAEQAIEGR